MKISTTLFLASLGSSAAFVAPGAKGRGVSSLHLSKSRRDGVPMKVKNLVPESSDDAPWDWDKDKALPKMSQSLPFMARPAVLTGSMAGDVGFDPLGLSKSPTDLIMYREAEIKHGRLAMLAAAGWPVSELLDKDIASVFGATAVLDASNRVPSVLNGGMGKISPVYWIVCLVLAAACDMFGLSQASKKKGYIPGDLGFDPLGMYPEDEAGQKKMQTAEIKNGRLAMIAITAFAAQEFVAHIAIVDQVPFFFRPVWDVVADVASPYNPFYIIPQAAEPVYLESVAAPVVTATVEAVTAVTSAVEPAAVLPPVEAAATAAVEAATAVPASVDAVSAAAVLPPVEAVPTESVQAAAVVAPPVDDAELVAAKKRIVELEAKLASISDLIR